MRPLLVLLLVAAAGAAFFLALGAGSGPRTRAVSLTGDPGQAPRVDPTAMPSLEDPSDDRASAADPVQETRTVHPEARRGNALNGRVLDAGRLPVAGAEVVLTRYGPTDWALAPAGGERVPDRRTTTDAEGRFAFRDLEPYVDHTVVASHPDRGRRTEAHLSVADGQISDVVEVVLEPGSRVKGTVTDAGGLAIDGVRVRLGLMSVGNLEQGAGVLTTNTDAAGTYTFPNVSEGDYTLTFQAAGFGKTQLQRVKVARSGELVHDVALEVAHLIAGTIRDISDARVIPRAQVEAYSTDRREEATNTDTESNEEGVFEFDDVRQGSYTLLVRADGYQVRRLPRVNTGEVTLDIELTPLPKVRGRVLDERGSPLREFTVQLRQPLANSTQTAQVADTRVSLTAARDGSFVIACPRSGEFIVEATHRDFASSFSERFFVVEGTDVSGIVVRMSSGGRLTGRVLDANGDPVAGALMHSHHTDYVDDLFWRSLGDSYPSAATRKQTRTASDGTFELTNLTPESYQVRIDHPDWAETTLRGLNVEDGAVLDLGRVELMTGATLSGVVYGPSGAGLPGALVSVDLDTQVSGDEHGAFFKARTNAEGRYTFPHLPPGQYKIAVERQTGADNPFVGMADAKATRRPVSLVDGQSYTQDFTLTH